MDDERQVEDVVLALSDPKSKAKSVLLTDEGVQLAEQRFQEYFGMADEV